MENQIQVFTDERFGKLHCYVDVNGTARFKVGDVARGLGIVEWGKFSVEGENYIRWERVNRYIAEIKAHAESELIKAVIIPVERNSFIPENLVYRLAMKANNNTAEKFQAWIADVVIPSIRKTGFYALPNTKPSTGEITSVAPSGSNLPKIYEIIECAGKTAEVIEKYYCVNHSVALLNATEIVEGIYHINLSKLKALISTRA